MSDTGCLAEVISVKPNKIIVQVTNLEDFKLPNESLKVGSYIRVTNNDDAILIAVIENFTIGIDHNTQRIYLIEALPLGVLEDGEFTRGGDTIAIPPKLVQPATLEDIRAIYNSISEDKRLNFCKLSTNKNVLIPIDGNKFFNKHIAILGSTGSGKSHTLSKILQTAVSAKSGKFSLNNSHIIIFDIHSEYKNAFPNANFLDINTLEIPYWLLNSDELEEILLDTGERDNYNQSSIFRKIVTLNKKKHNPDISNIFYDTPIKFDLNEVINAIFNLKNETKSSKNPDNCMIDDANIDKDVGYYFQNDDEKINYFFDRQLKFLPTKNSYVNKGMYADGTLDKFYNRLSEKIRQDRLSFMFNNDLKDIEFVNVLKQILGFEKDKESNITVIDLSDVPFEVLTITVSVISRLIFDYGYFYKRHRFELNAEEKINNDVPILMVYEEAHKYVPNSELTKYRASKIAIERIAKEGRKYGITLMLSSQRPSEISETIFAQCNNFISMRLTNPVDQNYVRKLLPDSLGGIIDILPSLHQGDALLVGDSIVLPSIVTIDRCNPEPSSSDIPYWTLWKEQWKDVAFEDICQKWK
ncbi:ATP-binding protein [Acinetobacter indicus]|uniref:anti-phage-associated helicase HerA n=1 Tax=Acinetobacter TaxID=469 RepID=UPI0015D1095A|nr:anti-phage-associated helicase HerA [Acinetobacter indicus]MCP0917047.1 ATP-binding protein [Acinetobacter indicus]MCP0920160.1 ATP-binding protein [Acinetobacter indicus]MCP0922827.1 ATP-binding protein [Acinetobacter indicus]UNW10274.1 ATP-binding protein [Acinetobacter indicus]